MTVILAILFLAAADWPTYRHDNRRTGVTAEQLSPPLSPSWIFRSPSPPAGGWARPVNGYGATKNAPNVSHDDAFRVTAVGNTVCFASSAENRIYAIDAHGGDVRWTFHTDGPPRLAPTLWQGKAYFGADDGTAYCLDATDGSIVWTIDAAPTDEKMLGTGRFLSLWPLRTGVMVEKSTAYFTAGLFPSEGIYFFAVDAEDGRILWRRQLDNGGIGSNSPQGYLLASDDSVWMTSRVAPTRWSLADGSPIDFQTPIPHHEWRFHNGGSYAQLWGEKIVYGQAGLLAYDPNGQWTDKYNRTQQGQLVFNWFNARRAIFHDGMAYIATDHHVLAVRQALLPELAKAECREFEETYKKLRIASHLTALESLAEHGEDSPIGRRLKETTLKYGRANYEQWPAAAEKIFAKFAKKTAWMLPRKANESMILAGNVLYAGGESEVVAIDAATGKLLWSDTTDSRVRGLAVANGRLLVSTIDGSVRCYVPGSSNVKKPKEVDPRHPDDLLPKGPLADQYATTARHIVDGSDVRDGYCLILGANEAGRLAYEIARRTRLNVYVVEPDAKKVALARAALTETGLYGSRISVEQGDTRRLPFPPYVFNLVICERPFPGPQVPFDAEEIFRVTKPCGGIAYVGLPLQMNESIGDLQWMERLGAKVTLDGDWTKIVRGKVLGSADWTHNYATAANTYCNEDPLVKGPFGILWYGEPGPRDRIERHAAGPLPLVVGSTMFLTGYDRVMAYDIYNGVCYWNRTLLGATRTGLPMGTSNLVADADGLFVVVDNKTCLQLDATSGETTAIYPAPETSNVERAYWGWIAKTGHLLLGSRNEHDASRRRADPKMANAIFAIDTAAAGKLRWIVEEKRIEHDGIAVADGTLFYVDANLTGAERQQAMAQTVKDASVEDRKAIDRRGEPIEPDLRKLVALDVATGRVRWEKPINVTDVTLDDTVVSDGRVGVACMVRSGIVVVHGTASLGHPYQEFVRGEFERRALYAFDSASGKFLWGGRRNYRKRPIVVGDTIYAEPHAWDLATGRPKTYTHPLTGNEEPVDLFRGYIGCGHLLGSGAALFGNKGGISHLNLDDRCGYTPLGNMSLACNLGAVPAGGVYVAPEGRSGCTCDTPIYTSIGLYPREQARAWARGIASGISTPKVMPVRHMAVNLGAPGFREDDRGLLWIPYPAKVESGVVGDWLPTYRHNDSMCYRHSEDLLSIEGTDRPWVFTSGYANTKPLSFKLIDDGGPARRYTVRLYFAEPKDLGEGDRRFDVSLQGNTVLSRFDIVREAGGIRRAVVKEFRDIEVEDNLTVALTPVAESKRPTPILCGIEAECQER